MKDQEFGIFGVSLEQIPLYLQNGEYFQALNGGDDGVILVPANVLKADPHIHSASDLRHLLSSLQFWIACNDERIKDIFQFIISEGLSEDMLHIMRDFETVFPFLYVLHLILQAEDVPPRMGSALVPLSNYVRGSHPCAMDILLHLSVHDSVLRTLSTDMNETDKETAVHAFISGFTMRSVASEGVLPLLTSLYEHNIKYPILCTEVARNGHLSCLQYLVENGSSPDLNTTIAAARNGHLHILEYLHATGNLRGCTTWAAHYGHLHCLKFLHSVGYAWSVNGISYASQHGHLDCLMFMHENGCEWDTYTCLRAAAGGHLACLEYAHTNGCPWDEKTCSAAAEGGHMECLLYARSHGCPWDASTCAKAARGGHLSVLQYAHENGCPWDKETRRSAEAREHVECLKYATKHGAPPHGKRGRKNK